MPPVEKSVWDVPLPVDFKPTKQADGKLVMVIPLREAGKIMGRLNITITETRHLRVEWIGEPIAKPLQGFEAWSNS